MKRLAMRLDNRELETLRKTRDVVLRASSYRAAIMALCDSALVERLCLVSLVETQLRRISVNLHQIDRKIQFAGGDDGVVLCACNVLDPLIDIFSGEVSCLRSGGESVCGVRREISIRMSADEKSVVVAVKKALKFRNFRSLILSLCHVVGNRIMPPDFASDYQALKEYGSDLNAIAKALNSGKAVDLQQMNLFFGRFMKELKSIALRVMEGR